MKWINLVGRMEARVPTRIRESRREARVFIAHVDTADTAPAADGDSPVYWAPRAHGGRLLEHLAIPELDRFIEGYIDGWFPGGWITLG